MEEQIDKILKNLQVATLDNAKFANLTEDTLAEDLLPEAWGARKDEATQAILTLIKSSNNERPYLNQAKINQLVREARIDELEKLIQSNAMHGYFLTTSGNQIAERIKELSQCKN